MPLACFSIVAFNQRSRNFSLASSLAQETIEEYRSLKKSDPEAFWSMVQGSGGSTEVVETDDRFTRSVAFENATRRVKVTVTVSWQEGETSRDVSVSSYFGDDR